MHKPSTDIMFNVVTVQDSPRNAVWIPDQVRNDKLSPEWQIEEWWNDDTIQAMQNQDWA